MGRAGRKILAPKKAPECPSVAENSVLGPRRGLWRVRRALSAGIWRQVNDDNFRGIEHPGNGVGISQPSGDNHGTAPIPVKAGGVPWEDSLLRGKHSLAEQRNPHLSAVGVAGQNQINVPVAQVIFKQMRIVTQKQLTC